MKSLWQLAKQRKLSGQSFGNSVSESFRSGPTNSSIAIFYETIGIHSRNSARDIFKNSSDESFKNSSSESPEISSPLPSRTLAVNPSRVVPPIHSEILLKFFYTFHQTFLRKTLQEQLWETQRFFQGSHLVGLKRISQDFFRDLSRDFQDVSQQILYEFRQEIFEDFFSKKFLDSNCLREIFKISSNASC